MWIDNVNYNCELEDIIALLQETQKNYLQRTKNTTSHIMIQCPYHKNGQEHKPSAGINKETGVLHCFTCGAVHSLPEVVSLVLGHPEDLLGKYGTRWLMRHFSAVSVEEREHVELDFNGRKHYLGNNNNTNRVPANVSSAGSRTSMSKIRSDVDKKPVYVTEEELDSYRYYHDYWDKRKITSDWLIELFDLGYDARTNCITFPVRDVEGNCLFVARRNVSYKYFNYPEGVTKPLYGLYEYMQCLKKSMDTLQAGGRGNGKTAHFRKFNEVVVCESMIDALTCWEYGKFALALNGLGNGLQFKQLRELPARHLILATDNDNAGMSARARIKKNVTNKLITQYILPEGRKDINELTKEEFDNLDEIF